MSIKVGDTVYYDGLPAKVVGLSPGEYGESVTFDRNGAIIRTTPGLDARFSERLEPPPGSWADVARMMAAGDDSGFDWDAWKDEMKDTDGKSY